MGVQMTNQNQSNDIEENASEKSERDEQSEPAAATDAEFGAFSSKEPPEPPDEQARRRNLEALYEVPLTVTARLGETQMSIKNLLNLGPGAVVELDRQAGEAIDLYVNGIRVGSGDAVVVDENFGLRITELISPAERIANL